MTDDSLSEASIGPTTRSMVGLSKLLLTPVRGRDSHRIDSPVTAQEAKKPDASEGW